MDPETPEPEPGEIVKSGAGYDDDGNPIRSVNVGVPAATIGLQPGDVE